jgi:NAD(P)-dependent dehydrogenase (short-subunit alcohol dehydrogenase family)
MIAIDLTGRTAWVTGGASGIGEAIVRELARAGARVVSLDRAHDRSDLDSVIGGRSSRDSASEDRDPTPVRVPCDVRDGYAISATVERLAALGLDPDILVNNAGIARDAVVWKMTDEQWQDVVDINLTGAFRMTRAAAPLMRHRQSGAIVNIASINALRGKFGQANYAASKAGLIGFTKAVARELARDHIRVNAVAPGFVDTPLTQALPEAVRAQAAAETLLRRLCRPQDVAASVLFLVSSLADHITGQVLVVDGGQTL